MVDQTQEQTENKSWKNFELVLYPENYDKMYMVLESGWVSKWAYIKHDKEDKAEHIHLMCQMAPSPTKTKTIMGKFNIRSNQIEKIKGTWADALAYLTHRNAKHKYQYSDEEVISNFDWKEESKKATNKNNRKNEIIERIYKGEIRRYNETDEITAIEHDKYYNSIQRAYKFRDSYVMSHLEEMIKMKKIIWIYGYSGTGKTVFAKKIAKNMNLFYRLTSTGKNMFDEYQDEPCIIMDDLRPDNISFVDLLGILDPYNFKSAYARYKNKALQAELIIITSIYSPENFVEQYGLSVKAEDKRQLYRRLSLVYQVTDEFVIETEYESNNYDRKENVKFPNVFKMMQEKEDKSKLKDSIYSMFEGIVLS